VSNDIEKWEFAAARLERGESVMLIAVAESSGSSPGRPGYKMFVAPYELCGSIGGGVMEVELVEAAKSKIDNGEWKIIKGNQNSLVVSQVHRKDSPNSSGMICSGEQTVIFFELNSEDLETVRQIITAHKNCESNILSISDSRFRISEEKTSKSGNQSGGFRFEQKSENEFLYEEKLGYKNTLFIVGGGHCALALSELMSRMDFHISLFDDRPDLNTLEKNKFADEQQIIESYDQIDEYISYGENVYVVVMTLGYKFDEIVVRKLFDKNFKYFGVLGSKAKMAVLLRNLVEDGFDRDRIKRIHTPIGIEINSRTPEEIAVSIAAEIISVKNSKD